MVERPDKVALLEAVAQFLGAEAYPAIADKRLNFRVLIAANLATVVAAELRAEDGQTQAELGRLRELLGETGAEVGALSTAARREAISALNRTLAAKLRAGAFTGDALARVRAHLKETMKESLAVNNPRFDLADVLEGEGA